MKYIIKRPICSASIFYILGILIGLYLKINIVFLCLLIILFSIVIYLFSKKIIYISFLIITLTGYIYISILEVNYENKYKEINDEVKIKGIIIEEPQEKDYKYVYTLRVETINNDNKYNNTKLILNLKKNSSIKDIPKCGDEIEIMAQVEKPDSARNYKGFDYKAYLKTKKIYGTMETDKIKIIANNKLNFIEKFLNIVQKSIKNNLFKILGDDEAALCVGILIGNRDNISEEIENNFKVSNLTHMLAVSGSHITYIISALALLLGKTSKRFTKIFTIVFLVFFMALTGFTASVIRASIMGILILTASLLYKKSDTINNLGISSLIILIYNPYLITDLGFLLSYAGTIGIIFLGTPITQKLYKVINKVTNEKINLQENKDVKIEENCASISNEILKMSQYRVKKLLCIILKYVINAFSITLSANIIIIPVMAYSFSTISFTFWISNILAGPVMEIVTIFGFIVYFISVLCFPIAEILGLFLDFFLSILLKIAEISSLIPASLIYVKTPYLVECIIYYLMICAIYNKSKIKRDKIFIWFYKNKYKVISILTIIIISSYFVSNLIPKSLRIYFVDVGQGDCTLIQTPENKNILIDGGGREFGNFDVGESTLMPYLLARRITTIDYMLISHFDSDHIRTGFFTLWKI